MNKIVQIEDDLDLLTSMVSAYSNAPLIYQQGSYWKEKVKRSTRDIKKYGISNFRNSESTISTSYGDGTLLNAAHGYTGVKYSLAKYLTALFPFNKIYSSQLVLTSSYIKDLVRLENWVLNHSERVNELLNKYRINEGSLIGNPDRSSFVKGVRHSHFAIHMLDLLDTMIDDHITDKHSSYMELGGGFGMNLYLMVHNFQSIKKYLYIDIAPNLYVSTQFLKANFGDAVKDFDYFNKNDSIEFQSNNELEIYCLLPQQIESFQSKVDIFHSANTLSEIPKQAVRNYSSQVKRILSAQGRMLISSYGQFNLESTFDPDEFSNLFGVKFKTFDKNLILGNYIPQKFYVG